MNGAGKHLKKKRATAIIYGQNWLNLLELVGLKHLPLRVRTWTPESGCIPLDQSYCSLLLFLNKRLLISSLKKLFYFLILTNNKNEKLFKWLTKGVLLDFINYSVYNCRVRTSCRLSWFRWRLIAGHVSMQSQHTNLNGWLRWILKMLWPNVKKSDVSFWGSPIYTFISRRTWK